VIESEFHFDGKRGIIEANGAKRVAERSSIIPFRLLKRNARFNIKWVNMNEIDGNR
jgi:hypothetical protein